MPAESVPLLFVCTDFARNGLGLEVLPLLGWMLCTEKRSIEVVTESLSGTTLFVWIYGGYHGPAVAEGAGNRWLFFQGLGSSSFSCRSTPIALRAGPEDE
jgi:hypothetical protein